MTRMARFRLTIAALVTGMVLAAADNSGQIMLEAAKKKEVVDGDLNAAIQQYKAIATKYPKERALVADALVHMAECYQKLGDAESRKIYEQIVRDYADQKEAVAMARAHLGGTATNTLVSSRRAWTVADAKGAPTNFIFYGQVSPDGHYVPYTNFNEKGDLFVHDFVTGMERRLTNTADELGSAEEYAEEAAFSRDSRQLAYTWDTKEGVELRLIGLQSAGMPQPRRLVVNRDLKWISPYSWSPDGKLIAVRIQRPDQTGQIGLVSVESGGLRVLKSIDWQFGSGIFFSPDGRYLAYDTPAGDPTGQHDIFIIAVDGSHDTPAVVHPSQDTAVGWSPDGKRLLFASDRSGSMALWALPVADGKPQGPPEFVKGDLGSSGVAAGFLGLTASGALYSEIYNPGADPSDIHFGPFDFATGKFLSAPTSAAHAYLGTNILPTWSPDGKFLAYASMRKTYVAIAIRSMETGQIREVVPSPNFTPGYVYFRSLAWAPDGKSFIVAAQGNKNGEAIFRIDAQSGSVSVIAEAPSEPPPVSTSLALSPDGKSLYFNRQGIGDGRLMKHDLISGEEKELIRAKVVSNVWLSRDGRYIGTVAIDDRSKGPARMMVVPTAGGAPREVISRPALGAVNFSPDGGYIATGSVDGAAKNRVILLIPVEGGEVKELMRVPDMRQLVVATWSPDSRSVLLKESSAAWDQNVLWRAPIDGGKPQKLDFNADRIRIAGGFLASPDWKYAAFQTPKPEKKPTEIWITENFLPASNSGK